MRLSHLQIAFTVFLSGSAVMVIELTGSRLLTPLFGSSISVWGSLIGVVLSSLTAGYYLGGVLSDRRPELRLLNQIVLTGGLLTFSVPFYSPAVLESVLALGLGDASGSLFASALILGPPTFLLGIVSPFAVKLSARGLYEVGSRAGSLYALSTFGSILGTFGTVFVLVPTFDIRTIFLGMGVALMAVGAVGLGLMHRAIVAVVVLLSVSPLGLASGLITSAAGETIELRETPYSSLAVVKSDDLLILYLNGLPHSGMKIDNPGELVFTYTRFFELALTLNPGSERVLFVGGGGFSGPKYFLEKFPTLYVDVVEIDPDVIEVAKKYFHVRDDARLTIYNEDGRAHLHRTNKKYDAVILDAYAKTYVPYHLLTYEFFMLLRERLKDDGVVVSNMIASLTGDTSVILWSTYKTMSLVFPQIHVLKASGVDSPMVQNLVLVACTSSCPLEEAIARWPNEDLAKLVEVGVWTRIPELSEFPVLTDHYSPAESMINPVTGRPYNVALELGNYSLPTLIYAGSNVLATSIVLVLDVVLIFNLITSVSAYTPKPRTPIGV
jgi:predicted membrane-bound spermidine synthase